MTTPEQFLLSVDPRWSLIVDGFNRSLEGSVESVMSLVNGYQGTRAAMEEGSAVSYPGTFIAGVFNTPDKPQADELDEPLPEIVLGPDWSKIRLSAEGQSLDLDTAELVEQRRVLDVKQGVLVRDWRVRDGQGRTTQLRSIRFASLDDRHALVQLLEITPENWSGALTLESLVDGHVTNTNNTVHLVPTGASATSGGALLTLRTTQGAYELAFAAEAELRDASTDTIAGELIVQDGLIGRRFAWQAQQGQTYELCKCVAVYTSRDGTAPEEAATSKLGELVAAGAAALLSRQTRAWSERWRSCEATVAAEDDGIQREIRWAVYQLAGAAWPGDERSSVGARSLTGERYRGHVFWDNETFVWPFFLFTDPTTARALLMYRYHTIAGARNKAKAMGYRGALYAWESTDTGEETTPPFVNIPGGGVQPILTGVQEHHIAADIAYAIMQYRQASGDEPFFLEHGAEMLLEIARFWASRATLGDDGAYHILTVIGPDEYHEHTDDGVYTNTMAQWTIQRALAAAAELASAHPARWGSLARQLDLSQNELDDWREVADGLVISFDEKTGLLEQFRGYFDLRDVDLTGHDMSQGTMDLKLGWDELQKTKVLKQADVVMLLFLLWDSFPPAVRETNFRYYEPRTSHDSSLSASFHALVAARLNDLPMAEAYLRRAALIDLDFSREGWAGATGGVHIAALGGIWQALAYGFLGMRPQDDGLRFEPHIPAGWGSLQMTLRWRGSLLRVSAEAAPPSVEVSLEEGEPQQIGIGDGPWQTVAEGQPVRG